jgi:hypothetical protein
MPKGATYTQSRSFPQIYESEAWVRQHGHDSIVGQWLSSCLFLSLFPVVLDPIHDSRLLKVQGLFGRVRFPVGMGEAPATVRIITFPVEPDISWGSQ